jgi:hypothetical protein
MFDREYELYDVFGKDPIIQPLMRYTSKLAYEKSKLSLLDVQCQQSISRIEISNFVQNNNYDAIAIFRTYSVDTAYEEYDGSVARLSVDGVDYLVNQGVTLDCSEDDVTSFYTNVCVTQNSKYHQLIQNLLKVSADSAFIKTEPIFTDPFTTYKIFTP